MLVGTIENIIVFHDICNPTGAIWWGFLLEISITHVIGKRISIARTH